ncbi:MAG: porin [Acidobacteriota bacterium]
MATRMIKILPLCLVFLFAPSALRAQTSSPESGEVETLRKKIEAQEAQIKLLREMLDRQQSMLEAIQQKLAQPVASDQNKSSHTNSSESAKAATQTTESVEAGAGKIRFNGLAQVWFASGNEGFRDTFRLRRAQLRFSGELNPKLKWTVMLDAAKALSANDSFEGGALSDVKIDQSSRILQEAFLTLDYIPRVHLDAGQFKVPLSLELLQQASALDTIERALFISDRSRGGLGVARDIGLAMRGRLHRQVDYQLGLFNSSGEHQNDSDRNDQKALIGRVAFRPPFIKGLQVGASGAWGGGERPDRVRRDRAGGEVLFDRNGFKFKSELMAITDGDTHRLGYYAHVGYRITPRLEPVFRFDSFDPNTGLETGQANVTERDYVAGLNYYINENKLKLQMNYLRKTFENGLLPSRNLVLVNLQTSW